MTFEKIVFYDSSNIDVEFDISGKERKALLGPYMKNIHEGMFYVVTFRVSGLTPSGLIIGQLKSLFLFCRKALRVKESRIAGRLSCLLHFAVSRQ